MKKKRRRGKQGKSKGMTKRRWKDDLIQAKETMWTKEAKERVTCHLGLEGSILQRMKQSLIGMENILALYSFHFSLIGQQALLLFGLL